MDRRNFLKVCTAAFGAATAALTFSRNARATGLTNPDTVKKQLERDGYRWITNSTTWEENYQQRIIWDEYFGGMRCFQLEEARMKYNFKHDLDETIWMYCNQGYEVATTQGYDKDGKAIDGLVAVYIRKAERE